MKANKNLAAIAFAALGLIWGSNFIYMKYAAALISPLQIVFLRIALALVPVSLYAIFTKTIKKSHFRYFHHFMAMSLLATVIYYFCFVKGAELLYSGIAGALSGATPLFSFILGVLVLSEEKLTLKKCLGILMGLLGIVVLAKPFSASLSHSALEGMLYMIAGSLSLGSSFIYTRKYISPLKLPAAALTTYQLLSATLILFFFVNFSGMNHILSSSRATIGLVIGLSLLGTGLAYILYYYIIEKLGAVAAASVTYIPPIVALIIGAFLVGEPIALSDYIATVLILIGVLLLKK